jgi:hypothetical protein
LSVPQLPPYGGGIREFAGNSSRVLEAARFACGKRSTPVTLAAATAARVRACATRRLGLSRSDSSIN